MHFTLTSNGVILTLLMLSTRSWATTTTSEDFTNQSADCTGGTNRVRILPFTLTFSPTTALTEIQQDVIKELAEDVLHDFFSTKVSQGISVEFVDLIVRNHALVRRRQLQDDDTAVLQVEGGIASFRGGEPQLDEVNAWASQALEGSLLEILQEEAELTSVKSVVFTSLTATPTQSPITSPASDGIPNLESTRSSATRSSTLVSSVVVGVVLVSLVILLAALWVRRRRRGVKGADVGDESAGGKGLPLVTTDIAEESDEDDTLKAEGRYLIAVDDTKSLDSGGQFLITVENTNTLEKRRNVQSSESIAGSVSSTASASTNPTVVPHQGSADIKKGPGAHGLLCALQVVDNACICHVSRNK